jgi:hypothetical protein
MTTAEAVNGGSTDSELENGKSELHDERYFEFATRRGDRRARSFGQSAAPGA